MIRTIKKYKNRRLYDMELSQYIKIEDLRAYVLDNVLFRVEDAATHEDITSATLLQIFVEMESSASQFLSKDMLRQLIILAQHPMNYLFKNTLTEMFKTMNEQAETAASNPWLKDYQKLTEAWKKNSEDMLKQWQSMFK